MEEIWKDINGYEDAYQISNLGNVRSKDRFVTHNCGGKAVRKGCNLKIRKDKDGYLRVSLKKHQRSQVPFIHRLIAIHFIPNPDNKKQVNHLNGIKSDNRIENLEWCTSFENRQHAYDTGLQKARRGEKNNWCKLKNEDVIYIRENYKKGIITQKMLGKKFNVTQSCIHSILTKRSWSDI